MLYSRHLFVVVLEALFLYCIYVDLYTTRRAAITSGSVWVWRITMVYGNFYGMDGFGLGILGKRM